MSEARKYITISIDDGHPTDMKSAQLLNKYGLRATFYIPKTNSERQVMHESDIRGLASSFEIGAHTISHGSLIRMPNQQMINEIKTSKDWIEQLTGRPVSAFCYPQGKFDRGVVAAVKQAGFQGARTCMYHRHNFARNPFLWGVSTHAHTHSRTILIRHALLEKNFRGLKDLFTIQKGCTRWDEQFLLSVKYVEHYGGIAHLYLHSWEIDMHNQWQVLDDVFHCMAERTDLRCITNGELFNMYNDLPEIT